MEAFHVFMNGCIKTGVFVCKVAFWIGLAFVTIIGVIFNSAVNK